MTRGVVVAVTLDIHDSSTSNTARELRDDARAATWPGGMLDPVSFVATSPPQPAAIIAVVVVLPLVPLTSTTLRVAANSSRSRGAKASPTRPPMTVPEPPKVIRERKLTARTALAATASRGERAGDICDNANAAENAKGPTGG